MARSGFQRGLLLRRRHEAVRSLLSHFVGVISDFDLGDEIGPAACDLVRHRAMSWMRETSGAGAGTAGVAKGRNTLPWRWPISAPAGTAMVPPWSPIRRIGLIGLDAVGRAPSLTPSGLQVGAKRGSAPEGSARLLLSRRGRERKRLVLPVHGQTLDDGAKSAIDEMPVGPEARHVRACVAAMAHLQPPVARMGPPDGTNNPPFGIDQRAARGGA